MWRIESGGYKKIRVLSAELVDPVYRLYHEEWGCFSITLDNLNHDLAAQMSQTAWFFVFFSFSEAPARPAVIVYSEKTAGVGVCIRQVATERACCSMTTSGSGSSATA
jgi:hypothetical protein